MQNMFAWNNVEWMFICPFHGIEAYICVPRAMVLQRQHLNVVTYYERR